MRLFVLLGVLAIASAIRVPVWPTNDSQNDEKQKPTDAHLSRDLTNLESGHHPTSRNYNSEPDGGVLYHGKKIFKKIYHHFKPKHHPKHDDEEEHHHHKEHHHEKHHPKKHHPKKHHPKEHHPKKHHPKEHHPKKHPKDHHHKKHHRKFFPKKHHPKHHDDTEQNPYDSSDDDHYSYNSKTQKPKYYIVTNKPNHNNHYRNKYPPPPPPQYGHGHGHNKNHHHEDPRKTIIEYSKGKGHPKYEINDEYYDTHHHHKYHVKNYRQPEYESNTGYRKHFADSYDNRGRYGNKYKDYDDDYSYQPQYSEQKEVAVKHNKKPHKKLDDYRSRESLESSAEELDKDAIIRNIKSKYKKLPLPEPTINPALFKNYRDSETHEDYIEKRPELSNNAELRSRITEELNEGRESGEEEEEVIAENSHKVPKDIPTKPAYPGAGQWAKKGVKHAPYTHKHYENSNKPKKEAKGIEIFKENEGVFNKAQKSFEDMFSDFDKQVEESRPKTTKSFVKKDINILKHSTEDKDKKESAEEESKENVEESKIVEKKNVENEDESDSEYSEEEFVPKKSYTQIRGHEKEMHLPPDPNDPRLKEVVIDKTTKTVYTEEGYEDSGYDHAGHEKNAENSEGDAEGIEIQDGKPSKKVYKKKKLSEPYELDASKIVEKHLNESDFGDSEPAESTRKKFTKSSFAPFASKTEIKQLPNGNTKVEVLSEIKKLHAPNNKTMSHKFIKITPSEENKTTKDNDKQKSRKKRATLDIPDIGPETGFLDELRTPEEEQEEEENLEEKYPYFQNNDNKMSPLRYAENLKNVPVKVEGEMSFYDHADKKECPEVESEVNPIPQHVQDKENSNGSSENTEEENPENKEPPQPNLPRLKGLGEKIDCYKVKYFGKNPLDSPFFNEEIVESPEPIFPSKKFNQIKAKKFDNLNRRERDSSEQETQNKEDYVESDDGSVKSEENVSVKRKERNSSERKTKNQGNNVENDDSSVKSEENVSVKKRKILIPKNKRRKAKVIKIVNVDSVETQNKDAYENYADDDSKNEEQNNAQINKNSEELYEEDINWQIRDFQKIQPKLQFNENEAINEGSKEITQNNKKFIINLENENNDESREHVKTKNRKFIINLYNKEAEKSNEEINENNNDEPTEYNKNTEKQTTILRDTVESNEVITDEDLKHTKNRIIVEDEDLNKENNRDNQEDYYANISEESKENSKEDEIKPIKPSPKRQFIIYASHENSNENLQNDKTNNEQNEAHEENVSKEKLKNISNEKDDYTENKSVENENLKNTSNEDKKTSENVEENENLKNTSTEDENKNENSEESEKLKNIEENDEVKDKVEVTKPLTNDDSPKSIIDIINPHRTKKVNESLPKSIYDQIKLLEEPEDEKYVEQIVLSTTEATIDEDKIERINYRIGKMFNEDINKNSKISDVILNPNEEGKSTEANNDETKSTEENVNANDRIQSRDDNINTNDDIKPTNNENLNLEENAKSIDENDKVEITNEDNTQQNEDGSELPEAEALRMKRKKKKPPMFTYRRPGFQTHIFDISSYIPKTPIIRTHFTPLVQPTAYLNQPTNYLGQQTRIHETIVSPKISTKPTKQKPLSEVHYKDDIKPNEQLNVFADIINNIKNNSMADLVSEASAEVAYSEPISVKINTNTHTVKTRRTNKPGHGHNRVKTNIAHTFIPSAEVNPILEHHYYTTSTTAHPPVKYRRGHVKRKRPMKTNEQLYEEFLSTIKTNRNQNKNNQQINHIFKKNKEETDQIYHKTKQDLQNPNKRPLYVLGESVDYPEPNGNVKNNEKVSQEDESYDEQDTGVVQAPANNVEVPYIEPNEPETVKPEIVQEEVVLGLTPPGGTHKNIYSTIYLTKKRLQEQNPSSESKPKMNLYPVEGMSPPPKNNAILYSDFQIIPINSNVLLKRNSHLTNHRRSKRSPAKPTYSEIRRPTNRQHPEPEEEQVKEEKEEEEYVPHRPKNYHYDESKGKIVYDKTPAYESEEPEYVEVEVYEDEPIPKSIQAKKSKTTTTPAPPLIDFASVKKEDINYLDFIKELKSSSGYKEIEDPKPTEKPDITTVKTILNTGPTTTPEFLGFLAQFKSDPNYKVIEDEKDDKKQKGSTTPKTASVEEEEGEEGILGNVQNSRGGPIASGNTYKELEEDDEPPKSFTPKIVIDTSKYKNIARTPNRKYNSDETDEMLENISMGYLHGREENAKVEDTSKEDDDALEEDRRRNEFLARQEQRRLQKQNQKDGEEDEEIKIVDDRRKSFLSRHSNSNQDEEVSTTSVPSTTKFISRRRPSRRPTTTTKSIQNSQEATTQSSIRTRKRTRGTTSKPKPTTNGEQSTESDEIHPVRTRPPHPPSKRVYPRRQKVRIRTTKNPEESEEVTEASHKRLTRRHQTVKDAYQQKIPINHKETYTPIVIVSKIEPDMLPNMYMPPRGITPQILAIAHEKAKIAAQGIESSASQDVEVFGNYDKTARHGGNYRRAGERRRLKSLPVKDQVEETKEVERLTDVVPKPEAFYLDPMLADHVNTLKEVDMKEGVTDVEESQEKTDSSEAESLNGGDSKKEKKEKNKEEISEGVDYVDEVKVLIENKPKASTTKKPRIIKDPSKRLYFYAPLK